MPLLFTFPSFYLFFFFNAPATTDIYTLSLHDALPISPEPAALRPTIGIHFAPPVVGCVAYLSITTGTPDLFAQRSEEHTSELQSRFDLVCRLLLEKKKKKKQHQNQNTLITTTKIQTYI